MLFRKAFPSSRCPGNQFLGCTFGDQKYDRVPPRDLIRPYRMSQDYSRPAPPPASATKVGVGGLATRSQMDRLRSEEHPSELQSLMCISYAVFCVKKKIINENHIY